MVNDGHFVLGESTGLVRADDLGTTESLNRGELTDNSVSLRHIGNANRENDGNDGSKSLGNRRNRKRDRDHKGVENRLKSDRSGGNVCTNHLNTEDYNANSNNEVGEDLGKTCELDLKGSLALLSLCKRVCDLTHLGVHTGSNYNCFAAAVNYRRAHKYHIFSVAESNVAVITCGERAVLLVNGHGLTGESRLLDLERSTLEDTRVCGNGISGLKDDNVADYEVLAGNEDHLAVTDNL